MALPLNDEIWMITTLSSHNHGKKWRKGGNLQYESVSFHFSWPNFPLNHGYWASGANPSCWPFHPQTLGRGGEAGFGRIFPAKHREIWMIPKGGVGSFRRSKVQPKKMGDFLKWWYPQLIHLTRVFHYFHHPFWGTVPLFLETPK